jgi:hypothetical protein
MFLTSEGEYNIWRIGPVQSPRSTTSGGVVAVVFVVCECDGLEVLDSGGFSEHHRLDVPWMASPTMLSPSSFPQTSDKMSGGEKKKKG